MHRPGAASTGLSRPGDLRIGVLGPVLLWNSGAAQVLHSYRVRTLLAMLVTGGARGVQATTLLDSLWPDPDVDHRAKLHSLVSRLRQSLAAVGLTEAIPRQNGGYVLSVPAATIDARVFEQAVLDALDARTDDTDGISAALELWRGIPFADAWQLDSLLPEIARITELKNLAVEELDARRIIAGEHSHAITSLLERVLEEPDREIRWAYLMVALLLDGRAAESLHTFQRAKEHTIGQQGRDPGRLLRDLELAVLESDHTKARVLTGLTAV